MGSIVGEIIALYDQNFNTKMREKKFMMTCSIKSNYEEIYLFVR